MSHHSPMPLVPEGHDWDLDDPGSRFSRHPSIALGIPESEWDLDSDEGFERGAAEAFKRYFGDWILEEQEDLGQPEAVPGSVGRGASGLAAVLEFVALHAAGGVISVAAGLAFKRFWSRARDAFTGEGRAPAFVSRGGAAYLSAAEVAERFGAEEPLEVEGVEEPSSFSGRPISELSHVGLEPWIVLLRNRERLRRYVVVVKSNGEILGALETPMGEWEHIFLPSPEESEWAVPPRNPRRRWWRRR